MHACMQFDVYLILWDKYFIIGFAFILLRMNDRELIVHDYECMTSRYCIGSSKL